MTQNALAINPGTAMPTYQSSLGAIGNENIDADTLATPRLYLLQALSEQVIKGNPAYVPGASAGMFLNSINDELYEELWVSNLYMTRSYNVNKRREFGTRDWRGIFPTAEDAQAKLLADGVNPADYDITDTHIHTLVRIDPVKGSIVSPMQLSMKGTGLKESRVWNSNIVTHGSSMPRFASIWKLAAKLNSNNKGSWYTPQVTFAGWAPDELFEELHTLYKGLRGTAE